MNYLRIFCFLLVTLLPLSLTADLYLFNYTFENPDYILGTANGQLGISTSGPQIDNHLIQNSIVKSGAQALEIRGANQAPEEDQTNSNLEPADIPMTTEIVDLSLDFYLSASTVQAAPLVLTFTPVRLDFFDPAGAGTGTLFIEYGSTAEFVQLDITVDAWHHLQVEADFGLQLVDVYLDGGLVADDVGLRNGSTFLDGGITGMLNSRGDNSLFIDNLQATVVPEPSTLLTFGIYCTLLARRRRRRQA